MTLQVDGAIDLHCHFSEDTLGGQRDPQTGEWNGTFLAGVPAFDVAREAQDTGHAAIVLKSHSFASPGLVGALKAAVPGLEMYSGICTDHMTGGLNISAVEAAIALGAKFVWLPTVHSTNDLAGKNFSGFTGAPVRVTDDEGNLLPAVHEIFALVQQADAVLATGHISAPDHYAVVREFGTRGKVHVTHAGEQMAGPVLTGDQCHELAQLGATIEFTAFTCTHMEGFSRKSPQEVTAMITKVGPEHCTLGTDYGWDESLPRPAAGYISFLERLWDCGIPEEDIGTMAKVNPARLLDLE